MTKKRILSKNALFQKFEVLKTNRNKRYKYKEFFVEGVRNINEAIKNNWDIVSFIYSFEKELSDWAKKVLEKTETMINYELTDNLMKSISSKDDSSEILAIVKMSDKKTGDFNFSSNPILALFDRPSKKGNLGTIIRSCDALGIEALIVIGHSVDMYDPEVISSTMGSFFKTNIIKFDDNNELDKFLSDLKNNYQELTIVGTTSHSKNNIYEVDMKKPVLFLIGNETDGLNNHLVSTSDILVTIPMDKNSSASSLNVSCATTVMFYEAIRQRRN